MNDQTKKTHSETVINIGEEGKFPFGGHLSMTGGKFIVEKWID
jgi:hypothetical protein